MTRDAQRWVPWRCAWATTLSGGAIVVVTDTASGRVASTWMSSPPSSAPFPKDNCPAHPRFAMTNSVSPMCLSIFARYVTPIHSFSDPSLSQHSQS